MDIQEAKALWAETIDTPPQRWNTGAALEYITREICKGNQAAYIHRCNVVPQGDAPTDFTEAERATGIAALQDLGFIVEEAQNTYLKVSGWATNGKD